MIDILHRSIQKLKRLQRLDVGNNEIEQLVSSYIYSYASMYNTLMMCGGIYVVLAAMFIYGYISQSPLAYSSDICMVPWPPLL